MGDEAQAARPGDPCHFGGYVTKHCDVCERAEGRGCVLQPLGNKAEIFADLYREIRTALLRERGTTP